MKKLVTKDVFAFARMLKAIGIKDEMEKISKNGTKDQWQNGFNLIYGLFDLATEKNGEKHIYEFLSGPFEMEATQVAEMDLNDLMDNIEELIKENDFKAFFTSVAKLMKLN